MKTVVAIASIFLFAPGAESAMTNIYEPTLALPLRGAWSRAETNFAWAETRLAALESASSGVPTGCIVMWSGTLASVPSGWALCDGQNGTPDLRDRFIKGWAAGVDPGGTGGSATHTPAGTVSQPTFTGSALGTHTHGTGTYAASAHSGTAVADHASHTHTYTEVPNHVHLLTAFPTATGGSSGFTVDTSMSGTPANNSLNTANPTGGVATGTTAGPGATLTHSVTQPSAHTLSGSSEAVSAGTPAGSISTPTFTGTSANTEPAYFKLAFIIKL